MTAAYLEKKLFNPYEEFKQKYLENCIINNKKESQELLNLPFYDFLSKLLTDQETDKTWVAQNLSDIMIIPLLDLDSYEIEKAPLTIITESLLHQYPILPLWKNQRRLYLGMANPYHPTATKAIRFQTRLAVSTVLVEQPKLEVMRKALLSHPQISLQHLPTNPTPEPISIHQQYIDSMKDPPLIRYVNQLLQSATYKKSSDIHFEPSANQLKIRFRIDGLLYTQPSPPQSIASRILSRIKIMAQMDIAERRLPQEGRFSIMLANPLETKIECRVSTCPLLDGEKIVIRLLSKTISLNIKNLGFTNHQRTTFLKFLNQKQGMILVTGPTGSGKTLTLYSALQSINSENVNISSVEDPVEIHLENINQVNVHSKLGLDFAEVLKVFLRQDPDIIMVGEMRDTKTVKVGIQAAQTGHLVLSTLHTNSAADTLSRLINMGVAPYEVVASVKLIIAQRLIRCLCTHCKQSVQLNKQQLEDYGVDTLDSLNGFKPKGCQHCIQGYQGRIGIFELLPITNNIANSMLNHASANAIESVAKKEGMLTLRQTLIEKIQQGIASTTELDESI